MLLINVNIDGRKSSIKICGPDCECDDCADKCREGPNAGKPGPCPKPKPGGDAGGNKKPPKKPKKEDPRARAANELLAVKPLNEKEMVSIFGESVSRTRTLNVEELVKAIEKDGGSLPTEEQVRASPPVTTSVSVKKGKAKSPPPGTMDVPDHIEFIEKLPKDQKTAVWDYTNDGFTSMNSKMRKCPPDFACVKGKDRKKLALLEKAIQSAGRLVAPINVVRGLGDMSKNVIGDVLKAARQAMEKGDEYNMPCVTSTSINKDVGFAKEGQVTYSITAKSGLFVASVSNYPEEQEFLQSAFTRYKVKNVVEGQLASSKFRMEGGEAAVDILVNGKVVNTFRGDKVLERANKEVSRLHKPHTIELEEI